MRFRPGAYIDQLKVSYRANKRLAEQRQFKLLDVAAKGYSVAVAFSHAALVLGQPSYRQESDRHVKEADGYIRRANRPPSIDAFLVTARQAFGRKLQTPAIV